MDVAAIKQNVEMKERSWNLVEKAGIQRCSVRISDFDMNAAHLNECKL
jgi:hypothetical protein